MSSNQSLQQELIEHDDNGGVPAKRVKNYVFNTGTGGWEKQTTTSGLSERYDYSNSSVIYTATAPVGTADASALWIITRYDLSDSSNASGKVATGVAWDDRLTESYL